jgi:hypothetical protein
MVAFVGIVHSVYSREKQAQVAAMWPYFIALSLPAFMALVSPARVSNVLGLLALALLAVFVGYRDVIGPDWFSYEYIQNNLLGTPFRDVWTRPEPLSHSIFWISGAYGLGIHFSNFIAASILLAGVWAFARQTVNPWLAVLCALPYLVFVFGMSGIRQSMAVGVLLYALSTWRDQSVIRLLVGILIASLFHSSALIGGFVVLYLSRIRLVLKVFGGLLLTVALYFLLRDTDAYEQSFEFYRSTYIDSPAGTISIGAAYHLALILFPAVLGFIYRKKLRPFIFSYDLLLLGLFGALTVSALFFFQTTVSSRLTLYLYFLPMMVYPALTLAFGSRVANPIRVSFVILHFVILFVWFGFANHSEVYLPYRNFFFSQ